MSKRTRFLDSLRKPWTPACRRFERLCALAATGQLGGGDMWELNQHIAACDSCRNFLESVTEVSLEAMPALAGSRTDAADIIPSEGMRDRFLARMAAASLDVKIDPAIRQEWLHPRSSFPGPSRRQAEAAPEACLDGLASRHAARLLPLWPAAAALAILIGTGLGGFYLGQRKLAQAPNPSLQAGSAAAKAATRDGLTENQAGQLERQKAELASQIAELQQKLAKASVERRSLMVELADLKEQLERSTRQGQTTSSRLREDIQEAQNQVAMLQSRADRLGRRLAESELSLTLQKQSTEELSAELAAAQVELQRQGDLQSEKGQIADILAARNLHIVDVYDADADGKRQRSVGRVFYIVGKSLVFYAYDLNATGRFQANVVFHVWGGKAGLKEVTHNLGILHKDDGRQGLWALTFDDPKILAQINAVFVTAESASKHYAGPHGKRILYAYFGSPPNHP